jgi:hypothetical protein
VAIQDFLNRKNMVNDAMSRLAIAGQTEEGLLKVTHYKRC